MLQCPSIPDTQTSQHTSVTDIRETIKRPQQCHSDAIVLLMREIVEEQCDTRQTGKQSGIDKLTSEGFFSRGGTSDKFRKSTVGVVEKDDRGFFTTGMKPTVWVGICQLRCRKGIVILDRGGFVKVRWAGEIRIWTEMDHEDNRGGVRVRKREPTINVHTRKPIAIIYAWLRTLSG